MEVVDRMVTEKDKLLSDEEIRESKMTSSMSDSINKTKEL